MTFTSRILEGSVACGGLVERWKGIGCTDVRGRLWEIGDMVKVLEEWEATK